MNGFKLLIVTLILTGCANAEFWRVVEEQRAAGYVWKEIECREPINSPNLPLETPNGNLVCNVLAPR